MEPHRGVGRDEEGLRVEDIRREYLTKKSCAPYCTISCVHQISYMDFWRDPQTIQSAMPADGLVQIESERGMAKSAS